MHTPKIKIGLSILTSLLSVCGFSQSLNPLNIGTVQPGDSIVIVYDVVINNPCGCTQISNQGNVSGSNFSSLVTDDPKTGTANDPTITFLNLFPLPVTLLEFRGNQRDSKIELSWKASEINVHHYEVERSITGASFVKIATISAVGNGERFYNFTDPAPNGNINYYRLKIVEIDGKATYSSILKFANNGTDKAVMVYPNPIVNSQVAIQLTNFSAGLYKVVFYNAIGQQVLIKAINHAGGSATVSLSLEKKLGTGLFTVVIKGQEHFYTQKILIRN